MLLKNAQASLLSDRMSAEARLTMMRVRKVWLSRRSKALETSPVQLSVRPHDVGCGGWEEVEAGDMRVDNLDPCAASCGHAKESGGRGLSVCHRSRALISTKGGRPMRKERTSDNCFTIRQLRTRGGHVAIVIGRTP